MPPLHIRQYNFATSHLRERGMRTDLPFVLAWTREAQRLWCHEHGCWRSCPGVDRLDGADPFAVCAYDRPPSTESNDQIEEADQWQR